MNVTLSRRGAVRIVCFSLAFVLTLTGLAMQYRAKSMKQQQILENQLMQTMSDLTLYASNVRSDLEKIQYVNTSPSTRPASNQSKQHDKHKQAPFSNRRLLRKSFQKIQ